MLDELDQLQQKVTKREIAREFTAAYERYAENCKARARNAHIAGFHHKAKRFEKLEKFWRVMAEETQREAR